MTSIAWSRKIGSNGGRTAPAKVAPPTAWTVGIRRSTATTHDSEDAAAHSLANRLTGAAPSAEAFVV